jgi:NAD(P)-dependent dehydrogenase (short-subunit alcohol dehydrogenase family)
MTLLSGKSAVITGGASGIGAAIVDRFAAEGARGVVLDLDLAGTEFPDGWDGHEVDVRREESVAGAFGQIEPGLDVLVTCAGIVPGWARTGEVDVTEWDEVFAVNVRGTILALRHGAPRLRDGGSVIAIGSINSWRGDPNLAGYAASKHAVLGIVRSAAMDLGARNIRVNALAPGPIATEALLARMATRERELGIPVDEALVAAAAQTSLGRIATIEEVAAAAVFLASDLSTATTGHLLPVDAGLA